MTQTIGASTEILGTNLDIRRIKNYNMDENTKNIIQKNQELKQNTIN